MLRSKRFLDVYAKILTASMRVVAAWFGFVGAAFMLFSLFTPNLHPWGFVAGIVFLALAIGGYMARSVRGEDLSRMQEDIGRSHVSELRTNRPKSK